MGAMRTYIYVSLIVLVYLCKLFYTSYSVFIIIFTGACPSYYITICSRYICMYLFLKTNSHYLNQFIIVYLFIMF